MALLRGEIFELRELALCLRPGPAGEIAEELLHFAGAGGHAGLQGVAGVIGVAEHPGQAPAPREDGLEDRHVVMAPRIRTGIGGAANPGPVHGLAQAPVLGMAQDIENDAGIERKQPTRFVVFTGTLGQQFDRGIRQAP